MMDSLGITLIITLATCVIIVLISRRRGKK